MKKIKVVLLTIISIFIFVAQANATNFNFIGNYSITDSNGDNFRDLITFDSFFTPNSGAITLVDPMLDSIIGGSILLADLSLDPSTYISGDYFNFSQTLYLDGFTVYNSAGTAQMVADLNVTRLTVNNSIASINSEFSMNLTNITPGLAYSSGSSYIIDSFLTAPSGGATNITLQMAGDVSSAIINSGGIFNPISSSYSGSATPVTEPATVLLFSASLLGLTLYRKEKKA